MWGESYPRGPTRRRGRFRSLARRAARGESEERPAALVSSLDELRLSLASPSPTKTRLAVGAWDGIDCVGALLLELPQRSDLNTAEVSIAVPPAHRRCGTGDALWRWALARSRHEGRPVLQAELAVPDGHTVGTWPGGRSATAREFVSANVEDHLVVGLPYDTARLTSLEAAAPSTTTGCSLGWGRAWRSTSRRGPGCARPCPPTYPQES